MPWQRVGRAVASQRVPWGRAVELAGLNSWVATIQTCLL